MVWRPDVAEYGFNSRRNSTNGSRSRVDLSFGSLEFSSSGRMGADLPRAGLPEFAYQETRKPFPFVGQDESNSLKSLAMQRKFPDG